MIKIDSSYFLSLCLMECFSKEVVKGKVIKRPSKHCKSPYVADVLLDDGREIISHAPSLGCSGLCEKDSIVYLTQIEKPKQCSHVIHLSEINNTIICIHPKNGEKIVEHCLKNNYITTLKDLKVIRREKKILNSRFDFLGIDKNNQYFILEVKSVPLCKDGVSYFPEGYRKKKNDVISPRALKHIQELREIKFHCNDVRTIMCFVVQRSDSKTFKISDNDKIYKDAVFEAKNKGVELLAIQINWTKDGKGYFINEMNVEF